MSAFKRYSTTDEIPPVPSGWLFVSYRGDKVKIVDSEGNSMMPRSRALVKEDDPRVQELISNGSLVVVSHATVSLENYIQAVVDDGQGNTSLQMLKTSISAEIKPTEETATQDGVSEEPQGAKEENVRKSRKKKQVDAEVENIEESPKDEESAQDSENTNTDTSASEEAPSV